ncbi:MAG: hypothetical protein R6X18_00600, partial [Chloroflexota bacterium]
GTYLALAWPTNTRSGGPPFAVQPEVLLSLFEERGFTLLHREIPFDSVPERQGQEELILMQRDNSSSL